MSDGTAPRIKSVVCGYCDTEAKRGRFGSLECPSCGRGISITARYSDRDEESRERAIQRHNNE